MNIRSVPAEDYLKLYALTRDNLHLLNINCTLKFIVDGCFEGSKAKVYEVVENNNKAYNILLELLNDASLICLIQSDSKDQEFVRKATRLALETNQKIFDKYESFLCSSFTDWVADELNDYFDQIKSHPYIAMDQQAVLFYATPEQQELLKKADLTLPRGFEYRPLKLEEADIVANEIISVKSQREVEIIASKIARMPSLGIIHVEDGLACYETNDGTGLISNLYTRPKFRNLGLAKLIEQKLTLENMEKHQIPPFKGVAVNRPRVIAMSEKSYLWTQTHDVNGGKNVFRWVSRSKTPQEQVEFYEN